MWEPREGEYVIVNSTRHLILIPSRRTGISLKEGRRDEHGMEEVDGLFSSPEKSPVELDGFEDVENESSVGSEGMSMDEGGPMQCRLIFCRLIAC